jgi:hypothetical protein
MDSVFSPTLTVDSDTTASPSSFIWIVDSSGQIHFAPDVSTAIAMYPGCSVAIAQTIVPGDPATVQAALGWQSSALTSAGKLYVMGNDGSGRWLGVGDDNVFGLTTVRLLLKDVAMLSVFRRIRRLRSTFPSLALRVPRRYSSNNTSRLRLSFSRMKRQSKRWRFRQR